MFRAPWADRRPAVPPRLPAVKGKDAVRARIVELRKKNYSIYDIRDELERAGGTPLGTTAIQEVLREEGFTRLPRRLDEERPGLSRPMADAIADVRAFSLAPRSFSTRIGGIFLLLPWLARLDLDGLSRAAACQAPR